MPESARKPVVQFGYARSADQDRSAPAHHRVIVVGAGPVGLTAAIDLAQRGHPVLVLDDADRIGEGSRAICFSKRALETWDRLGVADRMLEKGVVWQVGKVFHGTDLVYRFDLLPEGGHKMPAFINLQQYYAEAYLVDRVRELPAINLRWRNKVVGLAQTDDNVSLTVATPDGPYTLTADYVIAADGARSSLRDAIGAAFEGESFEDRFLIADVRMAAAFPTERWFWFDPPFHPGRSALLHKQPDDIWRIDLALGPDADPDVERAPARVRGRIRRMLDHDDFELEWVSLYRFQCRRMSRFVHGRVIFAGDAAHQVSPFGARGCNSGVEDAENIAWKLARVLDATSPATLLETYDIERIAAADDNIRASTWATDYIAPHQPYEQMLSRLILDLARELPFARRLVNAGRLSVPSHYDTPLSTPDQDDWSAGPRPGASLLDAPVVAPDGTGMFLTDAFHRQGGRFVLLTTGDAAVEAIVPASVALIRIGPGAFADPGATLSSRYDLAPGDAYLIRPDGYVAARLRSAARADVDRALRRAEGFHVSARIDAQANDATEATGTPQATASADHASPEGRLKTEPGLDVPDLVYRRLVEAHRGLTADECAALDASLVLMLANHIGDTRVVLDALEKARALGKRRAPDTDPKS